MNLQSDDFTLFGLPQQFAQDPQTIAERWKLLQRQAHPDRHAVSGDTAQRLAMQWSVRINEAYQRLRDPVRRAAYLCELHGATLGIHSNTAMPQAFLLQQMQWRETLDVAVTPAALDALEHELQSAEQQALADCAHHIDQTHDYTAAAQQVRALMFLARFADSLHARRDQLGQ